MYTLYKNTPADDLTGWQVHAMKKSKKGDEERSEEFSRVYEMPTENDVDPSKVTSSIYKDGVLTIELPVADALGQPPTQWMIQAVI